MANRAGCYLLREYESNQPRSPPGTPNSVPGWMVPEADSPVRPPTHALGRDAGWSQGLGGPGPCRLGSLWPPFGLESVSLVFILVGRLLQPGGASREAWRDFWRTCLLMIE